MEPTKAWAVLSKSEVVQPVALGPMQSPPPRAPGMVRFVCISDTHSAVPQHPIPDGDVLLHTGDFTETGRPDEVEAFCAWLGQQPHARKIVIAGNHDLTLDEASYPRTAKRFGHREPHDCTAVRALLDRVPRCEYLLDSGTSVRGVRVWGSPWQPEFCGWAFNLRRGEPLAERWRRIHEGTDVLMTHGPPLGHGDLCQNGHRAGCLDLLEHAKRVKPAFHVFGHIHEGYGATTDGTTTFVNASTCNLDYQAANQPLVFDLPACDEGEEAGSGRSASTMSSSRVHTMPSAV